MKKKTGKYIVHVDGVAFLVNGDAEIKTGDIYIAERNNGKKLLTAQKIMNGYIIPKGNDYAYNISECIKVENIIG